MSRSIVGPLTADVWTDLGAGPGVMEIREAGAIGTQLLVNNSQTIASAHSFFDDDKQKQAQFTGTEVASVRPTGPGWVVTWDPDA